MLTRELVKPGAGVIPDWYPLIVAARYLGVAPWTLAKQPRYWEDWALVARAAEAAAEDQIAERYR